MTGTLVVRPPMSFQRARLHLRCVVPPGPSLVGAVPFGIFRVESAKLSVNPKLELFHTPRNAVPFDGAIHDLRGDYGTTLCIGSHLSFHIHNHGDGPEPLELQVLGTTTVDAPLTEAPGKAPELQHQAVLGVFAQELPAPRNPELDDLGLDGLVFDGMVEP